MKIGYIGLIIAINGHCFYPKKKSAITCSIGMFFLVMVSREGLLEVYISQTFDV
jgi:hypothetical protein